MIRRRLNVDEGQKSYLGAVEVDIPFSGTTIERGYQYDSSATLTPLLHLHRI